MATITRVFPAPRTRLGRLLLRPGNIFPAWIFAMFVISRVLTSSFPPSPSTAGLIVINTVAMVLFVFRRDATKVGSKVDLAVALTGTFIVSFLQAPDIDETQIIPTIVEVVALSGWSISLVYLGRSFGIVAADRGLVSRGPYAFVRHPVYAFEALFFGSYLMAVPTLQSALILGVAQALQIVRIIREEKILQGYDGYKQKVRWRLVPFIW